jgi:hypothetical protein
MRIASLTLPLLLLAFGGCGLFSSSEDSGYERPNSLMADEIETRVQQIPFQHREELLQNLLWLSQTGESTIPTLLKGLHAENPKTRSSCAWVLGRMHDRRTVPQLQAIANDRNETVRLEVARSLVILGDMKPVPSLIEGLDSEKKEVRFLCHEALKQATGRDFGFDHLSDNDMQRRTSVLGWRQWWSEYSGDTQFARSYQERYHLGQPSQPMGETQPPSIYQDPQAPQGQNPQGQQPQNPTGQNPAGQNPAPTPDPNAPAGDPQQPDGTQPTDGTPGTGTPNGGTPGTPNGGTPNSGTPNGGTPNGGTPNGGPGGEPGRGGGRRN